MQLCLAVQALDFILKSLDNGVAVEPEELGIGPHETDGIGGPR